MGLMFNAVLKIPMQFFILFTGVMLFVFYQMHEQPISFNQEVVELVQSSDRSEEGGELMAQFERIQSEKTKILKSNSQELPNQEFERLLEAEKSVKAEYNEIANDVDDSIPTKDSDYVFIRFILDYLPHGAIGLLLAVILSAAMSSTAGELNALATTTMNDFYQRLSKSEIGPEIQVRYSKLITVGWGILAIMFALAADLFDNLIEVVNILGSLFYGTILGVFLCAVLFKVVRARPVFIAALIAESIVLIIFFGEKFGLSFLDIGFLWFNVIGAALVVLIALLLSIGTKKA